ncbi:MAG TPA: hypothetical protein ENJ87_08800 [Gammaproteobacteria bacterium]|nr:hypothetical protein [Gammaproteobacteria bacterium]
MFNRFYLPFLLLFMMSTSVLAVNSNNPFARNKSINIGKDISWEINKDSMVATKSAGDDKGNYYHLRFDNRQLELFISSDPDGDQPKNFTQLEIKDVKIDGKQSPLFKWCLNNQQRHSRFLQQGLSVKKNICEVDSSSGSFVMHLNSDTLAALKNGNRLSIMIKPYRTPLDLTYDISDFKDMFLVLNTKPVPVVAAPADKAVEMPGKKCWAGPPAKYKNIKSVEYDCDDTAARNDAEKWVIKLVNQERAKDQKLATEKAAVAAEKNRERERLRKAAEEKKKKQAALKLKQDEVLQAEAAAIAASVAKQAQIGDEITQKMLKVCNKYWSKGEHRCYCQKYIDHAPAEIKAKSTCE